MGLMVSSPYRGCWSERGLVVGVESARVPAGLGGGAGVVPWGFVLAGLLLVSGLITSTPIIAGGE